MSLGYKILSIIPCSTSIGNVNVVRILNLNTEILIHQNMFGYLKDTTLTGLGCMILVSLGAFLFVSPGYYGTTTAYSEQGFDNGWWGTIQGANTFGREYGSCMTIDGIFTCTISTSQKAAGSSVQSGGISKCSRPGMQDRSNSFSDSDWKLVSHLHQQKTRSPDDPRGHWHHLHRRSGHTGH